MAAVGEKELSEYRLLQHPELKKLPVITASSTQQNYHIRQAQANPLYFLLDGITDSDEWMNWRPKSEDVAPWIRIKFNTRRNIGRVILYTGESGGSSAIAAATIKTRSPDGKWADHIGISDNKNNVINLPFSPVSTDEVEISIPKINRSAAAAGILSEIEIYEK